MPENLLRALQLLVVVLLYLFFARVLRAVWTELHPPKFVVPSAAPAAAAPVAAAPPPAAAAASAPPKQAGRRVTVTDPDSLRGAAWDIAAEVTVGRSPGCGIPLADPTVSSVHARLFRQNGQLVVEDLGSRNGTYVNSHRISAAQPLYAGDRVGIGPVVTMEVRS